MTRNVLAFGVVLVTAAMFATGTQVTQAQSAASTASSGTAQSAAAIAAYWTPGTAGCGQAADPRGRVCRGSPLRAPTVRCCPMV